VTIGRAGPLVCAGAIFLSSLGLDERRAGAAPLTVTLEYAAEPGCPDITEFKAVVVGRLGRDPFVEAAPEHVLVRIESHGRAMDGRIEWRDAGGKWTGDQGFPSVTADCPRLVRTMGFALAVEIQLLTRTAAEVNTTPAGPVPAIPAENARPDTTSPLARTLPPEGTTGPRVADVGYSPTGKRHPAFATGAGPSVGFGISSAPVLLGRLFGAVAWQFVSVELAAVVSLPTTTRRADGAGFSQQHFLGSSAACATVARWRSCVLGNAGVVRMNGENIGRANSASVALVQAGIRAGIGQRLGRRVLLNAHADGLINLTRWTARLDRVPVWTAPRFAAELGLDVTLRFP